MLINVNCTFIKIIIELFRKLLSHFWAEPTYRPAVARPFRSAGRRIRAASWHSTLPPWPRFAPRVSAPSPGRVRCGDLDSSVDAACRILSSVSCVSSLDFSPRCMVGDGNTGISDGSSHRLPPIVGADSWRFYFLMFFRKSENPDFVAAIIP